jgi:hypothetical protein
LLYTLKSNIWLKYQTYLFDKKLNLFSEKKIILCDIDNTLSQSELYPYNNSRNKKLRFEGLPVFKGMRNFLLQKITEGYLPIFISARPSSARNHTLKWLKGIGMNISDFQLIIVPKAENKLYFIRKIAQNSVVFYVDDLSYIDENGNIRLYQSVIDELKTIKGLVYYGKDEINELNETNIY